MTTSVTIHVNGRYVATVEREGQEPFEVHGVYDGSPNPSGNYYITAPHPATLKLAITERYLGEAVVQPPAET